MHALLEPVAAAALSLTLAWTVPTLSVGPAEFPVPAECVECAVLFIPQKLGARWWEQPTVIDTLAKLPAQDGAAMAYLVPLWVGYGATNVVCRDAAGNWSRPSNGEESKNP